MRTLRLFLMLVIAPILSLDASAAHAQSNLSDKQPLLHQFDTNGDGWLDAKERAAARAALHSGAVTTHYWTSGFDASATTAAPGRRLTPSDVRRYGDEPLYQLEVLRTVFITFQEPDWEQELIDFYHTDVDVPAKVVVDGQIYPDVGVHFRGLTSFRMVGAGHKHSMDLNFDFLHKDQRLLGYRKLELLNAAADPTFLRSALFLYLARQYFPAPQANYLRLVINGESWGVYVNEEHLTGDFTRDTSGNAKSIRFKVPGSPRARGGLEYWGEEPGPYKEVFEIKSKDRPESWAALIHLCKVLNQTPPQRLPAALPSVLDVDGALRFLALDKTFINNDGYWTRSSDYSLYTDGGGRFHVVPHDVNETFRETEELVSRRAEGSGRAVPADSVELDPLANVFDASKPLYRLLLVPAWRQRYLDYVHEMAVQWLDWRQLGPLAQRFQSVIAADIALDTRKLYPTESFTRAVYEDRAAPLDDSPISPPELGLKGFATQRRAYLLKYFSAASSSNADARH
jgi:hypothetical protein